MTEVYDEEATDDRAAVQVICESTGFIGRLHRFRVNIGGREVATCKAGNRVRIPVRSGPHLIKVVTGTGGSSPSIEFFARPGEMIDFRCRLASDSNLLRVWKLSHAFPVHRGQIYEVVLERVPTL